MLSAGFYFCSLGSEAVKRKVKFPVLNVLSVPLVSAFERFKDLLDL